MSMNFYRLFHRGAVRAFSTACQDYNSYKFVVAGGGAGGIACAASLRRIFGKDETIAIIEPSQTQYYQPLWTLVGAGVVDFENSGRPMEKLIPKGCEWIQAKVERFHPDSNTVVTHDGEKISYEYLIVALGLQLRFDMVDGLPEALHSYGVCSNYSPLTVKDTWKNLQSFQGGNALFTLPNTPIKCLGAPQKIMYLTDDYLRKNGVRDKTTIHFCSALGTIFGVQKYAKELLKICKERDLNLNFRHNLIRIDAAERTATFDVLGDDGITKGETKTMEYDMIHVTPPMSAPLALRKSKELVDGNGFLDVHQYQLQHKIYPNIFGLGDCTNTPNGKTAAAVAGQTGVLIKNLLAYIDGTYMKAKYDGYTSCPLVTSYGKCILAEFDYNAQPLETFPINQAKERYFSYLVKKDILPEVYWSGLMKGAWYGPGNLRKALRLGLSK